MLVRNSEVFDKLFFSPALDERLKHISDIDQMCSVLEFFINERLLYIDKLSTSDCYALMHDQDHSKTINNHLVNVITADIENTHPLLFGYYALITDSIYKLDPVKLENSIKWFHDNLENNPHYSLVYNNLIAIDHVRSYQEFNRVALLENVYLNLAKANLPKANLSNMKLCYINLAGANLKGANLMNSQLNGTNLNGANLDEANLQGACLQQVVLNCSLRNADMSEADLRHGYLHKDGLDLTGARLCNAIMDDQTLFLGNAPQSTQIQFEKYVLNKKMMLSQIEFFDKNEFTNLEDLSEMKQKFNTMYEMLKDNSQFSFIQNCISHDFIRKMAALKIGTKDKKGNPELANKLYNLAYTHPLFEHDSMLVRAANLASRTMFSLFYDDMSKIHDIVESESQEQMRAVFGAK